MSKKQELGRGLSALLEHSPVSSKSELVSQAAPPTGEKEVGHVAGPITLLNISQIEANPYQPRKDFNNDALIELATSIGELGLIQPITVRKVSSQKYQIIMRNMELIL